MSHAYSTFQAGNLQTFVEALEWKGVEPLDGEFWRAVFSRNHNRFSPFFVPDYEAKLEALLVRKIQCNMDFDDLGFLADEDASGVSEERERYNVYKALTSDMPAAVPVTDTSLDGDMALALQEQLQDEPASSADARHMPAAVPDSSEDAALAAVMSDLDQGFDNQAEAEKYYETKKKQEELDLIYAQSLVNEQ